MSQFGVDPNAGSEDIPANTSEPLTQDEQRELSGATDTPETVEVEHEETDEQKNERALQERRENAEKRARGVQRRIDELTADKHAERQAAEDLRRQNAELLAALRERTPQARQEGVDPNAEPQKADYDDWEKYNRAVARWEARQEAIAVAEAVQQRNDYAARQYHAQQQEAQLNHGFSQRQDEFAKARPDYHEKMAAASNVMIPASLGSAIKALPNGPAVALFMAENPQVAEAVANQSPLMQGVVLGNISAHVSTSQVSNAPRPGKPVGGSGAGSDAPPADAAAYARWAAKRGL